MLTLQKNSLNWALKHALKYGDTDVFPLPFEFFAIEHDWESVREFLIQQDILKWKVRPHRILLSPKAKYGFRVVTQLDPLDFLIFSAVIKELSTDIERARVPSENRIVFSYRVDPDNEGQLFSNKIGYNSFRYQCKKIIKKDKPSHVAVTDISDFYSRIYHHRLEGALQTCTTRASHVTAIMHLLSEWNETETYGIPVGSAPSRLLAEITLNDIDEALLAHEINFVRYNDDYRIFTNSFEEAYKKLAYLADILYKNHGLNLQPQKTTILTCEKFSEIFLKSDSAKELDSLESKFDELITDLDLGDRYQVINYDDLTEEQQEIVDSLNLSALFKEELLKDSDIDMSMLRFVLRRLGQLGDKTVLPHIFDNINILHPILPDVIKYIEALRGLSERHKNRIGFKLISLYEGSIVSSLDYHKLWILDLFSKSGEWNNNKKFAGLLANSIDQFSKRKLILAMGRSSQRFWFQSQWRNLFDQPPWIRRATIAGASCLAPDPRKHWYKSIGPRLDPLETAVMKWAKVNPFAG